MQLCKKVKEVAEAVCTGMKALEELKKEAQGLKAQLQEQSEKAMQKADLIYDRADKCGNKLEVMEYRMEGLVYQEKDARRHVVQCFTEFRMDKAGSRGIKVLDGWLQDIARNWLQARCWLKDLEPKNYVHEWRSICKGAIQDAWVQYKVMKEEASRVLKDKGDIKENLALEEDCQAIKENLEVHIKKSLFILEEENKGQWEEEVRERIFKALNSLS